MERTDTLNPIEYHSWNGANGKGFLLLPISNYHSLVDVEAAKHWLKANFETYQMRFDWQVKNNLQGYKPTSIMMRTQRTKDTSLTVRKDCKWVELIVDDVRIVFDKSGKNEALVVIERGKERLTTTPMGLFASMLV